MSQPGPDLRLPALRRFAIAITFLNILGHFFLGFEQSWAHPLVALLTAYTLELLLEWVDSRATRRPPRFLGGWRTFIDFMLPAHITGLAVSMLLYANEQLLPIVFAVAVAVGSKSIFRAPVGRGTRHYLNPSNFGITVTLLVYPWVGIAPPYQFTENLSGWADWILPALIIISGTLLNTKFTGKWPLILGWVVGFVAQAVVRSLMLGTPVAAALIPMTGVAFILFTFYMVTDPATTPFTPSGQVLFGAAVAVVYGVLTALHIVFGLFFALTLVCIGRAISLHVQAWAAQRSQATAPARAPTLGRWSL